MSRSSARGWHVSRWPIVIRKTTVTELRALCAEHGTVLAHAAPPDDGRSPQEHGFVVSSSGNYLKVRWAPHGAAMQRWRKDSAVIAYRFKPEFDDKGLAEIGHCLGPDSWPYGHPFRELFREREGIEHGGGWHQRWTEPAKYDVPDLIRLLNANRKLAPGLTFWRGRSSLREALEKCMPNLWAVEQKARKALAVNFRRLRGSEKREAREDAEGAAVTMKFCRWLRREAKLAGVTIPKPPVLPPKPKKTKGKS